MDGWTHRLRANAPAVGAGAVVVLGALALYVATAARDIVYGDSPELTAVALSFGVAHPPGYPVFTSVGWLFGQIPSGPPPFRIALFSAACHAATVGVVYVTALRLTRSVVAGAAAAAALATAPLFWHASLIPEVFPLNDLLAATTLLLVALWHERPARRWLLVGAALAAGLGMADQQTIILLAPAILYVLARRAAALLRDPLLVRDAAVALALGLTPYLVLLVAAARHPVWSWGDLQGPGDLLAHIVRSSYGTTSLLVGAKFQGGSPADRVLALLGSFDPLQWLLLAVGAAYAWRVRRWYVVYLGIAFLVTGPAFALYSNADLKDETTRAVLERFFLMPMTVVAPLAGFAVVAVADLSRRIPRRLPAELAAGLVAVAAALAFVPLSYAQVDESGDHAARTFAMDILDTLKPGTLFLAGGDAVIYPIWYLQTMEGARADVTVVAHTLVTAEWYVRELRREHPELSLREVRYGPGGAPFRGMVDASAGRRPISAIGDLPDDSTKGVYWFYSRGLVYDVLTLNESIPLDQMASDTDAILARYHPPQDDLAGPFRAWQRGTLADYGLAAYRVGHEYETTGDSFTTRDPARANELHAMAKDWYRRALALDPTLAEARQGLSRVGG